jgi:malonyl-CoA decarboxylase
MQINQWITSVAVAGKELMSRWQSAEVIDHGSSIKALCAALYSNKGEALGTAMAEEFTHCYRQMSTQEKSDFFLLLAEQYSPEPEQIGHCAALYAEQPNVDNLRALTAAVESPRQTLLRRINMAPTGTRTIVNMRNDLLALIRTLPQLVVVEDDLKHLLTSWFNPGFLELKRIDWTTPANILEKLIEYEAVHAMQGWDDLRRRLDDKDRRCFGFFHPALPDEPLIFVEVALVKGIASSVQAILSHHQGDDPADQTKADTAIFYSISNCQPGLKGISFGNFLIKHVVMVLKEELPQLQQFSTLSPIPGFKRWLTHYLQQSLQQQDSLLISPQQFSLLSNFDQQPWLQDEALVEQYQPLLMRLCAHYLLNEKRASSPLDPVARFHLGNGANVSRLNWMGDSSANGLKQSAGILVNYRYDLTSVEENHEKFFNNGVVAASAEVKGLLAK